MIIGHVGVAFAARWRWPKAPLVWMLIASLAPDLWRLVLASSGRHWHETNLYSHVLPWSAFLALVMALLAYARLRNTRIALLAGALVLSHIALDMFSGWKVLWVGGPAGLDVEHFEILEFVVEALIAWAGWALLRRSNVPRWVRAWPVLALLLSIEASYLLASFRARPWKTRCIAYPVAPCWSHM